MAQTTPVPPTTASASPASAAERRAQSLRFFQRVTLEDYERIGRGDPRWDADARQTLEAFARVLAWEFRPDGDEYDVIWNNGRRARELGCNDPLVLLALARAYVFFNRKYEDLMPLHMESAKRIADGTYHPWMKCMANLRAAALRARSREDARASRRDGRRMMAAAMDALPRMLADPEVPVDSVLTMYRLIGDASAIVERDRAADFEPALTMLEQSGLPKGIASTVKAEFLLSYASDARRDAGLPEPANPDSARLAVERIEQAESIARQTWELDKSNAFAAELMMRIVAAPRTEADPTASSAGAGRVEAIRTWFDRAAAADPECQSAYATRLALLEPGQAGGSVPAMVAFGRECLATGRWESGIPMLLIDAHLRAACFDEPGGSGNRDGSPTGTVSERAEPRPEYFRADAAVWNDVRSAYEPYLRLYPDSLFHRGRYAQLASWCGQWAEAERQIKTMGDEFSLSLFRTREQYQRLRTEVASHSSGGAP
jgi:hypothetical protein